MRGAFIFFAAWVLAYSTVSAECQLMGSFLVGSIVFDCQVRK